MDETRLEKIRLCKLSSTSAQPTISHSLIIESDLSWKGYLYGHEVKVGYQSPLKGIPDCLDSNSLEYLIQVFDSFTLCPGNPDCHFLSLCDDWKGKFLSIKGEIKAYEDK